MPSELPGQSRIAHLDTGLEVRLYPNAVEFWRDGTMLLAMAPAEYGTVMRWIEGRLSKIAVEST